jgi:hypothetical protein
MPGPRRSPASYLPLVVVILAAAFVFRGSLAYFFSADDFVWLARARGIASPPAGVWRWLSGTAYFALMRPFGLDAFPYHAVNLATHAACAGLLFTLLRPRFGAPAALVGATFFAVHPSLYTAVYWISTINESLALLFALLTIACAARPGRVAWAAVPLFALSLLAKETTLLLPVALWITPGWLDDPGPPAARRQRTRVRIALAAVAAAYLAHWVWTDAFGTRTHLQGTAPYAVGIGVHVIFNAFSYLGWTVGMLLPATRRFEDIAEPGLWPWALAAIAIWIGGLFSARLRAQGWLAGGVTYAALLAPVIALRNHTYHYYLYAPLIGASWCLAALVDLAVPARAAAPAPRSGRASAGRPAARGAAIAWPVAAVVVVFLVLNGESLVSKIEQMPFVDERLRADPVVDRALIARRVYDGLTTAALPADAALVFWSPSSMRYERRIHPDADVIGKETYWERNVRTALQDGLAVRVMIPQVDSVEFVHAFRPAGANTRFVLYDPDGTVSVATPAHVDSMLRAPAAP